MKLHPLTAILNGGRGILNENDDYCLRTWLTEKAKELDDKGLFTTRMVRQILSLDTSEPWKSEIQEEPSKDSIPLRVDDKPKEPNMEKWCEHIHQDDEPVEGSAWIRYSKDGQPVYWAGHHEFQNYNFCPICGTPRPVKKTLKKKFDELRLKYMHSPMDAEDFIKQLVSTAATHYGKEE